MFVPRHVDVRRTKLHLQPFALPTDLHYFYNQAALNWFVQAINLTANTSFRALDPSKSNGYAEDEPIERILERMMIDRWTQLVSFENYFLRCQPIECRYSFTQKFDLLYIITLVTALLGGLTSALQLLVPHLVRLTLLRCFLFCSG